MIKTALYTVTYSGLFYKGGALPLAEIFPRAAEMGFDGIAIGAKRPVALPMDLDASQRKAILQLSVRHSLEIGCVESYSNLASPVMEQRDAQLTLLHDTVRLAHDIGAPIVKVFAAWPGVTLRNGQACYELAASYKWHDVTELEQWHWVRDALHEAVRWAEEYGVRLALQNHRPVTNDYRDVLAMIKEIDSPWLKACIDAPHLEDQTDEGVRRALQETGKLQLWTHFGGYEETADHRVVAPSGDRKVNYPAFFRGLDEIGYEGSVAYEGCGPALIGHDFHGIEEVDRRAKLALAYMKREIAQATAKATV
jgi:sugar phosphate isomerase/epimerase